MKKSRFPKLVIAIIVALIIPVFSYTILQFKQSDSNEELLKSIYSRQLEGILFSVNQYCWDVFTSWSIEINNVVKSNVEDLSSKTLRKSLHDGIMTHPTIIGCFIQQTELASSIPTNITEVWQQEYKPKNYLQRAKYRKALKDQLSENHSKIQRIIQLTGQGYVRPIAVSWTMHEKPLKLLIFPTRYEINQTETTIIAGLFIDPLEFINEIVARKFSETNDGNFIFAIRDRTQNEIIYATDEIVNNKFEKEEALWILPDLDIQLRLVGTTLDEIARSRNHSNLVLLGIVNVLLIIGIVYVIRNVAIEMSLVKMKTDFVASVSHELRTPLTLIRMFAENLEMERVRSKEKKFYYYKTIVSETSRLTHLINNILDFSRIESGKKDYHFSAIDCSGLVRETLATYKFHLGKKNFKVEEDIAEKLPAINADYDAVKLAFANLLDNAIKFSLENKHLKIGLHQTNGTVALSVEDHGIGIPVSEQQRILGKFYRVDAPDVHNITGSGLGLSLVKHVMDVHKGEIKIKSKPGEGSVFTLLFPVINERIN